MPARRDWAGLLLVWAFLAFSTAAWAELSFPPLSGRVVDDAGILDADTVRSLDTQLAAQEAKATDQFVIATVRSLQGTSIEDYANRLFRFWQLGQARKNNGVLLLVAPTERKVRIEVGYGLEGILTDAVSGTIIRTAILPSFKAGNMPAGIEAGAAAILEILNLDPEEAKARASDAEPHGGLTEDDWVQIVVFAVMVLLFLYFMSRGSGGGRGFGGRRRGVFVPGPMSGGWGGGWGGGSGGGGFSGGGGSSGGGGASGGW
ncbi:TPM domain-containing protein [Roseixanthobacter glucoisosaccharinicivorans]|uniref:TPM domain-containing protein n=1 Tax=Roseixanthobacter glucoisosaccharinicivorans TaxID=3119923 RepID=UPI00372C9881